MMRPQERRAHDDGSTLVLTLGYALLAMALILVTLAATDMHIAQKRLDALADAAALAGADGFTLAVSADGVRAHLDDAAIAVQAQAIVQASPLRATVVEAGTPDGSSARVRLTLAWAPPLITPFVRDGVILEATAISRTAFR